MNYKTTFLFLLAGIMIYALALGTSSITNIFLVSIYICLLIIIKQNERNNTGISEHQEELLNIINNIPIPAFLKDTNNNIIAANKDFFNLLKIEESSDYKTLSKSLYSRFNLNEIAEEDKKLIKDGDSINCEKTVNTASNCIKYKIYKKAVLNNKKVKTIAVFIKSIETEQHTETLENNKNIIATLTHDLKTPAVAQIRAIELLLKGNFGEINENQRSFLNDILNSCNNMLDMLINMLWLYKFDNKRVAVNISSFEINDLLKDIFNENKLLLNIKNSRFEKNNRTAKIHILADKMHIKRVISNILINAVNHSRENSIIYIDTSIENNQFIFKVTNEGDYLPEELLKCLFDKDKIFNQKCDGLSTGLGLYLSNSLLELNGGKFIYSSSPKGLNTFGFVINLYPQKSQKIENITSPGSKYLS